MHKILFISSANLTTNPRLAMELIFAVEQGYNVNFIGFKLGNWSDEIDKKNIQNIKADFKYIPLTRKPFFKWLISSLIEKLSQKLYPFFKHSLKINAYAHSKRSFLLCNYLKKHKKQYDLIIAHTLAALYPAYKFAKQINASFIFDVEDYHPGESIAKDAENEQNRREFLMNTLLPHATFITYASPLIGEYTLKLLKKPIENHQLINNCFSQSEFQFKENPSGKIKFVWFSQNIAAGRGLELVIPILAQYKNKIELHLIGNLYTDFNDKFLTKYSDFIKIIPPLAQKELNLKLADYDIGLAIEPEKDLNNKIAVSNKIWAYFQSGLYILATNTLAQKQFIEEYKNHGIVTGQTVQDFTLSIEKIIMNIDEIRKDKKYRFEKAKQYSWEIEQEKIKDIWNKTLS